MSYVSPNSTVNLLKNVPLDPSYRNTIYFSSPDDGSQYDYFYSKLYRSFTSVSYQRVNKGAIRLEVLADDIYDCNYMMFQNTAFGSKWFYAFVTDVIYINNVTSEIHYQLDVMQSWWFEAETEYCFVEREHSAHDEIGYNIMPEGLECGEYVMNSYDTMHSTITDHYNGWTDRSVYLNELCVAVCVCDTENSAVNVELYDKIISASTIYLFDTQDTDSIASLISNYVQSPDSITGIYMLPKLAVGFCPQSGGEEPIGGSDSGHNYVWQVDGVSEGDSLDGYVPKNNKLYTYPYNFLGVYNHTGNSIIMRYEFCESTPSIYVTTVMTYPIQCTARPYNYGKTDEAVGGYYGNEIISLSQYPQCSWNTDTYAAWVAQNSVPLLINTITSVVSQTTGASAFGGMAGAAGGLISSIVQQIGNIMTQAYTASIAADISKGDLNNGNTNCSNNLQTFSASRFSIKSDYAESIDNFFSMFGYATRKVKRPNKYVRENWTYTKTIGCNIVGNLPADDRKAIEEIYDNGITFWVNGDSVGDYSLDNSTLL